MVFRSLKKRVGSWLHTWDWFFQKCFPTRQFWSLFFSILGGLYVLEVSHGYWEWWLGKKTAISVQISLHPWKLAAGTWKYSIGKPETSIYIQTHNFGGFMIQNVGFPGCSSSGTAPTKKCFFPKPWTFTASWLNGTTILAAPFSDDGPVTTTSRDFSTCHMSRRGSSNTKRGGCYQVHLTWYYDHNVLPPKKKALNPLLLEVGCMDVFSWLPWSQLRIISSWCIFFIHLDLSTYVSFTQKISNQHTILGDISPTPPAHMPWRTNLWWFFLGGVQQ